MVNVYRVVRAEIFGHLTVALYKNQPRRLFRGTPLI